MTMNTTYGQYLRYLRKNRDLSLDDFVKIAGNSKGYWSNVENDKVEPPSTLRVFARIAKALQIERHSEEWRNLMDLSLGHRLESA
jgi:transcriptional regulator with XRE-family HTH domain